MDRYWLLTWTCFGHWLPGDSRGFVGNMVDDFGDRTSHNLPDTPYDADLPRLEDWVRQQMTGDPVFLSTPEAQALVGQYQETSRIRKWSLEATSVMSNHTRLVVGVTGDPDPEQVLELFKSWATRAVKRLRTLPPNGTFWTAKGSKRKLPDEGALNGAVIYVTKKQPNPLAVWWDSRWQPLLDAWERNRKDGGG